jgi:hypothetical protein
LHIHRDKLYYQRLIKDLNKYIKNSFEDSMYYEVLAQGAPNQRAGNTLKNFSKDKAVTAQQFIKTYNQITGAYYKILPGLTPVLSDYKSILEERLGNETARYKEYGLQYIKAPTKDLQDLFFNARTVSAIHAMGLPLLLEDNNED